MKTNKIPTLPGTSFTLASGIAQVKDLTFCLSDKREVCFWSSDPLEGPEGDLFDNVVAKANFIRTFNELIGRLSVGSGSTVLEVGAGHGWASVLVKRMSPTCYVVCSDLSVDAIRFCTRYERFIGVNIQEKWSFNAQSIPFESAQFDVLFGFACLHHFLLGGRDGFKRALGEMIRVLRPGGKAVFLYEPSSPSFFYRLMFNRVNGKRSSAEVDEDVIRLPMLREAVGECGAILSVEYYPYPSYRSGVLETAYYSILNQIKPVASLFPCTVNLTITKPIDFRD